MADSRPDISAICRRAVQLGQNNGVTMDYSPESIGSLEVVLDGQHMLFREGSLTEEYVWNLSVMIGVYLGQTLLFCGLRDKGFDWLVDAVGVPLLYNGREDYCDVIGQVRMRIMRGRQDSISTYFVMIMKAAGL